MNEMDAFADAEFLCAPRGLRGEERAHIDTDTDTGNGVIPSPGTKHLSRAAAEIENASAWLHA